MTYWMSVVRFVPDPARGEFVNVGAIAGSDETEEWEVRAVANWRRAKLVDDRNVLGAVMNFIGDLQARVEIPQGSFAIDETALSLEHLQRLSTEMRNIVQITTPFPVAVDSAAAAIELAFEELIVDPASRRFPFQKKFRAVKAMKDAYGSQGITPIRNARVHSGPYDTTFDFAVANGKAVQLIRCWSFQLPDQVELADQIKAWAWAVRALRLAGKGHAEADGIQGTMVVDGSVDVEAVFVPPAKDQEHHEAYDVAMDAFDDAETRIVSVPADDAERAAAEAVALLKIG